MRPRKTTKCSLASVVIQSAGRTPFVSLTFHEITLKYLQQINHNLHQQYTTALGTQSNKLHSKIQSYKRGNSNHYAQMCVCACVCVGEGGGSNLFEVKIQAEQMQYPANLSK